MATRSLRPDHESLLARFADALARVAQEHGEDVESDALLSPPTEEEGEDTGSLTGAGLLPRPIQ